MSRARQIDRIRKLLALADEQGGGYEGERSNAAEKAQTLMLRWRIDEAEVGGDSVNDSGIQEVEVGRFTMRDHWKYDLYELVGDPVGVDALFQPTKQFVRVVSLVGRPDMVAYVRVVTEWIAPQLLRECEQAIDAAKRHAQEYGTPWGPAETIRFRRSFYVGANHRLRVRLRAAAAATSGSRELVRSDRRAMEQFYGSNAPKTSMTRTQLSDEYAAALGDRAGQRVDLDPSHAVDEAPKEIG